MTVGKSSDAEDMISVDDFMGFLKENPLTKLDVLACVGSFALERYEKREEDQRLAQKKKKMKLKQFDDPLSPRSVLNCFLAETTKKKRSKRPRLGSELDLNLEPPLKKLKEESVSTPDLGVGSELKNVPVPRRNPFSKSGAFVIRNTPVGLRNQIERMNGCNMVLFGEKSLTGRGPEFGSELDLNQEPPLEKLKVDSITTSDLGVGSEPKKAITVTAKRRKPCPKNNVSVVSRDIPVGLRDQIEMINGRDMLLLVEKTLTDSDVNSVLSRLMMPEAQMVNSWNKFLTEEEYAYLKIKVGNKWNGLDVSLIEPSGQGGCSKITLRRWEMKKQKGTASIEYVLASGWNSVVSRNQLKSGNIVQVWSFRVDQKLHLALLVL